MFRFAQTAFACAEAIYESPPHRALTGAEVFRQAYRVVSSMVNDMAEFTGERPRNLIALRTEAERALRRYELVHPESEEDFEGTLAWMLNHGDAGDLKLVLEARKTAVVFYPETIERLDRAVAAIAGRISAALAERFSEDRHINAWIEEGEPPLEKGRTYRFAMNVGQLCERALVAQELPEIDWRDRDSLKVLIVVSGYGFSVQPRQQEFLLPRQGNTELVFFGITPTRSDSLLLRISLYLARELTLLQEFEISIAIKESVKAA